MLPLIRSDRQIHTGFQIMSTPSWQKWRASEGVLACQTIPPDFTFQHHVLMRHHSHLSVGYLACHNSRAWLSALWKHSMAQSARRTPRSYTTSFTPGRFGPRSYPTYDHGTYVHGLQTRTRKLWRSLTAASTIFSYHFCLSASRNVANTDYTRSSYHDSLRNSLTFLIWFDAHRIQARHFHSRAKQEVLSRFSWWRLIARQNARNINSHPNNLNKRLCKQE